MKVVGCLTSYIIVYDYDLLLLTRKPSACGQLQRMNDNLEAVADPQSLSAFTSTLNEISDNLDEVKIKHPMNE